MAQKSKKCMNWKLLIKQIDAWNLQKTFYKFLVMLMQANLSIISLLHL